MRINNLQSTNEKLSLLESQIELEIHLSINPWWWGKIIHHDFEMLGLRQKDLTKDKILISILLIFTKKCMINPSVVGSISMIYMTSQLCWSCSPDWSWSGWSWWRMTDTSRLSPWVLAPGGGSRSGEPALRGQLPVTTSSLRPLSSRG